MHLLSLGGGNEATRIHRAYCRIGRRVAAIAHGQKTKLARIGVLYIGTADEESLKTNLREGLRELGYVEGQNMHSSFGPRKESWSDFLSSQLSWFD